MPDYQSFETDRLILKPTSEEDAAFVLELLNMPKWLKYIGDRNVKTTEEAKTYIKTKNTPQFERLGFGNYTVIRKSDGVKVGNCGLYDREGLDGIDIGFAFLTQYEGQGYAFESANKIKEIGFEIFNIKKIGAITSKENLSSQKLLKKLGLKYIKPFTLPDDEEELMYFEMAR
jgi:RimJ/RimL family protein N-acetyltransferase